METVDTHCSPQLLWSLIRRRVIVLNPRYVVFLDIASISSIDYQIEIYGSISSFHVYYSISEYLVSWLSRVMISLSFRCTPSVGKVRSW